MSSYASCFLVAISSLAACASPGNDAAGSYERSDESDCVIDGEAPDVGDVNEAIVDLGDYKPACSYAGSERESAISSNHGLRLGGPEFFEKNRERVTALREEGLMSASKTNHFNFGIATDAAKRCSLAAQQRYLDIMSPVDEDGEVGAPPAEVLAFQERDEDWSGLFYNWNDDYSETESHDASARVFIWSGDYFKFISATRPDGTCSLPTLDMVVDFAKNR